uniref:Cyclic nucleotide-binding domain-containing protein n=1 Tax=Tetraselmis chuii TaxID=63592 RepID=A0A7S1SIW7_9CHLO
MDYKWRTRRALDEGSILSDMPGGLRAEVALYTCKPLITRVPFFNEVSDGFIESLVLFLEPEVFLNGEIIIKEGVIAREMFFLNTGSVSVSKDGIDIVTLHKGNYFGEIGLLLHAPRSATVASITDCEVYVLHKASLHEVLADFPEIKSKLEKVAEERLQEMLLKSRFTSQFPAINEDLDIENESKGH